MNNNDIEYALSGTGCHNIGELRMAFDILRDRLFVNHNEAWDARRVAGAVAERMYTIKNDSNCNQMQFEWHNG